MTCPSKDTPMTTTQTPITRIAWVLACLASMGSACATGASPSPAINLYSARHYATDEALYSNFTKATGIKINRVDADDAGIVARLKAEGAASPADVVLLVDAVRLHKAESEALFLPIKSKSLENAIPVEWRGKMTSEGASPWFGFSTRARIVVFDKKTVKREDVDTYEELADPKNKGKLCIRYDNWRSMYVYLYVWGVCMSCSVCMRRV